MRLVATLTTGYHVQLAAEDELLESVAANGGVRTLVEKLDQELPWVETVGGAWIRREAIIALHLEHDGGT